MPWGHVRALTRFAVALAVYDTLLLAIAARRHAEVIRDGADSVTTGGLVAYGILVTLGVALLLSFVRLPKDVARHAQVFALLGQALHATGHLGGLYYAFRFYDDILHAALTGWLGVLAFSMARSWRVIPARQVTPLRAALIIAFAGMALAGSWEIFEYSFDAAFGSREQDNLQDTMNDMIAGAVGSLVAALVGYVREDRKREARASPRVHEERSA